MGKFIDMSHKKYGRYTVLNNFKRNKHGQIEWECECECGSKKYVDGYLLRIGHTISCGCYAIDVNTKHGMKKHPAYRSWCAMKNRCYSKNNIHYSSYGGAGITVCDEWIDDVHAFAMWADSNGYKNGLQVDRIDGTKGYSPDNCRIVTNQQNQFNTMSHKNKTGYKGVYICKNKWQSKVTLNGKNYYLGSFNNAVDAALAYDKKAIELFGEYACVNFK